MRTVERRRDLETQRPKDTLYYGTVIFGGTEYRMYGDQVYEVNRDESSALRDDHSERTS
jgi:hypothetical protein